LNNNQPSRTPHPYIQGLAPSVRTFLTRVSGNEVGDCPDSDSDNEEENPSQGFYINSLVTKELWTPRARTDDDQAHVLDNENESDITVLPSSLSNEDVDSHHGLYCYCDGVFEEPFEAGICEQLCDASQFHDVYFPLGIQENHCA
jgi:hypothetical protein